MRYQIRWHLFLIFGIWFIVYFIFLSVYTKYFYLERIEYNVEQQYDAVFNNRLETSSEAISTVVYYLDVYGIEIALRLADIY